MEYDKPSLSCEDQATQLISRGLVAPQNDIVAKLKAVNYYRLSGYWFPFCDESHVFQPGTTLKDIWERYTFDRHLRLLTMDALERIEISIRTCMTEKFTRAHGPFGHLTLAGYVDTLSVSDHKKLIESIRANTNRSKEAFVKHFRTKYSSDHADLPLWMAVETMTFGNMFTMFRHLNKYHKRDIAKEYGLRAGVFESWLKTLNYVRNVCAHHGRLWNREIAVAPMIPNRKNRLEFHEPVAIDETVKRMFSILTILKYMMDLIAPQSRWTDRFRLLLQDYPDIPLEGMHFPEDWEECPIWSD